MLVLTRKKQEVIQIGDNVFIKVLKVGKNSVKIGIAAPEDIRVLRAELSDETVSCTKEKGDDEIDPQLCLSLSTVI
ncbi:hypothetical protein MNBD_PLANCTO02-1375 [hydrothermal vent metagenome]|uniref:Carbon storage regulator n=1 Tax=hydrothermal vent metagenome TaxID=652676 RepID=A0A3B1DKW5_9ZZZZ